MASEDKEKIESLVKSLEDAVQQENYTSMKDLTEDLNKTMMEVGQKIYSNAESAGATPDDGNTIETDFSVEK